MNLTNFETNKLMLQNVNFINISIMIIFFIVVAGTFKAHKQNILDRIQTEQLKGLAIFFVFLGHFWVHVANQKASVILSGEAVSLFFVLSGFGITKSSHNKQDGLKLFIKKRIHRVMKPYWVTTGIILFFDYIALNKSYDLQNIAMTLLGININSVTQHIDYVRWYVSLLLFWYIVHQLFLQIDCIRLRSMMLFVMAFIVYTADYYFFHLGWYQVFAFPLGCVIALYFSKIQTLFERHSISLFVTVFLSLFLIIFYQIHIGKFLIIHLPFFICSV